MDRGEGLSVYECLNTLLSADNPSSLVYGKLIDNCCILIPRLNKWEYRLGRSIEMSELHRTCMRSFITTNIAKLRSFQYLIVMHALTLNDYLFERKIKTQNRCYFCNDDEENSMHSFWNCQEVKSLWYNIQEIILEVTDVKSDQLTFNLENLLFNRIHERDNIANTLCLFAKYYLFKIRYKGARINIDALKVEINIFKKVSSTNTRKNGIM